MIVAVSSSDVILRENLVIPELSRELRISVAPIPTPDIPDTAKSAIVILASEI